MSEEITWEEPPISPILREGDIHVWRASLEAPETAVREGWAQLSSDETERARRFHFERDQRRFVIGRALLRRLLERYTGNDARNLEFSYSDRGKPSLVQHGEARPLFFSLSHSHELVLYGFRREDPLGIDVEYLRSMRDIDALATRFFSEGEARLVRSAKGSRKQECFFTIWTVKEAYVKATGEGLAALEDVEVLLSSEGVARAIALEQREGRENNWMVRSLFPHNDYVAAIAAKDHSTANIRFFDAQALL